jgi:hypothetical protein
MEINRSISECYGGFPGNGRVKLDLSQDETAIIPNIYDLASSMH